MTTATLLLKGLHTDQHLRASSFTSLTSSLSPTISLDAATTLIDLEFPFSITDRPPPMDSLDKHLIVAYTCHPRAVPTNVSGWTRLAAWVPMAVPIPSCAGAAQWLPAASGVAKWPRRLLHISPCLVLQSYKPPHQSHILSRSESNEETVVKHMLLSRTGILCRHNHSHSSSWVHHIMHKASSGILMGREWASRGRQRHVDAGTCICAPCCGQFWHMKMSIGRLSSMVKA